MKLYNTKTQEIIVTENKTGFRHSEYWIIPLEWTLEDAMKANYRFRRSRITK